ncbi:hypothetical protein [Desulfosporosinus sp. SB140]|uniref:hypothetical protein n=1 Tax=Desulfosporosinus paludis TaxID=3115649 RepID=UPI00388FB4EE
MSYFSKKTYDSGLKISMISHPRKIPIKKVKGIVVALLLCTTLGFALLWQPAYDHLQGLKKEKNYWQKVLKTGVDDTGGLSRGMIPSMDQLPDIIEQCQDAFGKEGVKVAALNVERFGERNESSLGVSFDYTMVRLHLQGKWENIVPSLNTLEDLREGIIHVQEVVLDAEGGEVLLQIYCYTGK